MGIVVAELPWLADQAREIQDLENSLQRKTHEVRKRQGEILLEVKEKLGHGNFIKWLKRLGWSDRTARNYIQEFRESSSPKLVAGKPELELIEAEVVEIYDQPMISAAKEDSVKSASLAVLDEGTTAVAEDCLPIIEAIRERESCVFREDGAGLLLNQVRYRRVEEKLLRRLVGVGLLYGLLDKHTAASFLEIDFKNIKEVDQFIAESRQLEIAEVKDKDYWQLCERVAIAAMSYRDKYLPEVGGRPECKIACNLSVEVHQFSVLNSLRRGAR